MKIIKYITPLILAFLGFLIYSNILNAPFAFDDWGYIAENQGIKSLSYFKNFSDSRYIGLLSFAINYYFGGLNTFGYHVVNVVIHILNAMLVYILIQLTIGVQGSFSKPLDSLTPRIIPFAVSLIFLVHPIQTQAVTYITQRFVSLATLFYLLAIVLYVKARLVGQGFSPAAASNPKGLPYLPLYIISLISTILAMKTKEISFTLPFMIVLYEFTFFNSSGLRTWSRLLCLTPYLLTLAIIPLDFLIIFFLDEGSVVQKLKLDEWNDLTTLSKYGYLLTQFKVVVIYIGLLIFPANQHFTRGYPLYHSIFEPAVFLSFILLLIIFSSAVFLYLRSRKMYNTYGLLISFGILWFFITLSVESSIIPIGAPIHEHRLYLPSIGFMLAVVASIFYGFEYLEKKIHRSLFAYALTIIVIITLLFSIATYKRNIIWTATYTLLLDEDKKSPNSTYLHYQLGLTYAGQSRYNEALKEWQVVIKLEPSHSKAHNNIGNIYLMRGEYAKSILEYSLAINADPNNAEAHYNLALALENVGRKDEATKEYLIALKLNPELKKLINIQ